MHRTTASRPTGAPTGQKQPGEEEAQAKQAEAAARAEGQSDRAGRDSDQPNTPPDRQTSHQTRPEAEIRQATANIKAPPFYQNERGAGTRQRAGHPPRFALAGRGTGRQGPRLWAAFAALRGACLGLAGRDNGRHSRPQAAFPAPRRARMRGKGGACAASARGGLNCGPPQGQGRRPQGAARLGRWKRRGPRPRYAGRRVRRQSRAARPAPQAWPGWQGWPECRRPGRRGGRPHSPHVVGAGPPRSTCAATERGLCPGQGPRSGPLAGLALRRARVARATAGGQLDRDAPIGAALAATFPGLPQAGRAGGGTAAAQGGQGVGPQAGGAGGTRPARRRDTDGSPFPWPLSGRENEKRECPPGTPSCLLIKGRPASKPDRWRLAPAPT